MDYQEKLVAFFKENFMVELGKDFNETDSFLDNGIIDSTGVLELITYLEENFNIKISDEDIIPDNFDSLKAIINYIKERTN